MPREYNLVHQETGELLTLPVKDILELINDDSCHSDEWTPYDESDWIEGLIEFTDYNLSLGKGETLKWKGREVEVLTDVIVSGGFGKEITIVPTSSGDHHANKLC